MSESRRRRAFTLVELLIALAILAVAIGLAVPTLQPNDRARLIAGASLIASDLEYAQSLSISTPDDLAMIRFNPGAPEGPTHWVAHESATESPILKPYVGTPYLVTLGQGAASELTGLSLSLIGAADRIAFDEFGRSLASGTVRVRLTNGSGSIDVGVSGATGFITIEAPSP